MVRIVVSGAAGRMGRRLLELVQLDTESSLAGALESPSHPLLGHTAGSLAGDVPAARLSETKLTAEIPPGLAADVIIDFSAPEQTVALARTAAERGWAIVVGTTGLNDAQKQQLVSASARAAVLVAPNYALGMNVLFQLVAEAARHLQGYDIEILESHHRFKKDAPSGSALRLAERAAEGAGRDLATSAVYGRKGLTGERRPGEIGIHAIRRGDVVGEHTVTFTTLGETLELTHRAHSRDAFARGALHAAKWLAGKPAGRYTFEQVLGLA
jgi:4-hydroxy-tetrahydrodipicolinate reductase